MSIKVGSIRGLHFTGIEYRGTETKKNNMILHQVLQLLELWAEIGQVFHRYAVRVESKGHIE